MVSSDARSILDRLRLALGVKTQAQLAAGLGIRPQSIVSAVTRGEIPQSWLYQVAYHTGRSVEWLRTGRGSAWRGTTAAEAPPPSYDRRGGGDDVRALLAAWGALAPTARQVLLRCAEVLENGDADLRSHLAAQMRLIDEAVRNRKADSSRRRRRTRRITGEGT